MVHTNTYGYRPTEQAARDLAAVLNSATPDYTHHTVHSPMKAVGSRPKPIEEVAPVVMPAMDSLSMAKDHPAVLLAEDSDYSDSELAPSVARDAANVLRNYEASRSVTFAALNNQALAEVRRYLAEVKRNAKDEQYVAAVPLADLVEDLLNMRTYC